MKSKTHGWVVSTEPENERFVVAPREIVPYGELNYVKGLENAHVFATRALARHEKNCWFERVRKVRIENGEAIEIIPGR
jgi:hypothetical protein